MLTKQTVLNYCIILTTGFAYGFTYLFQFSFSPIVDVLEAEFDTTSSGIGIMSSLFWFGYFTLQIPAGVMLEIFSAELITVISLILLSITLCLFSISTNIIYASIICLLCGITGSVGWLAILSIIAHKLSNNDIPFWTGLILFFLKASVLGVNTLQSFIYDTFGIWRQIFFSLSICSAILLILFSFIVCVNQQYYHTKTKSEGETKNDTTTDYINDESMENTTSCLCFPIWRQMADQETSSHSSDKNSKFSFDLLKKAR
eukprot:410230_1